MPVPTYDKFIEPILRYLAAHPRGVRAGDAHEAAAKALGLTPEEKQEVLSSGQPYYKNRAGWAHDRLKRAGLSKSPKRGTWFITEAGQGLLAEHPHGLPDAVVNRLATAYNDVMLRDGDEVTEPPSQVDDHLENEPLLSPDEQIEIALGQILTNVAADLLERLSQVDPSFFERIVLDLLHRMGYGATRQDLKQTPDSNDGGIDGIISLDALGLERVYVQAKRWAPGTCVGRPEIQGFYGALAGHRAVKGVFITTARFSTKAKDFANSVDRIVLIDGERPARLMTQYGVGVSTKSLSIPSVDSDYFEE